MSTNIAMWSLIIGTVLPPFVAIVQQPTWPSWLRSVVMIVVSVVAGAGTAYFTGTLNGTDWVTATLIILVAGISTYKSVWTPTGIAPKIESATSPKP